MRIVFAVLLIIHALIHVMGVVKAFDLAPLDQLKLPISHTMGLLWLGAALALSAAAVVLLCAPRWFWLIGLVGLVLSQLVIVTSWSDARFGTVANLLLLAGVLYTAFAFGPFGLRAEYEQLVHTANARAAAQTLRPVITDLDLERLPAPVARYLRVAGVVGTPRLAGFRARMTGRIRSAASAPWMPFTAEQHSFFDPPRRYFWMEATRGGVPIDGLHAYGEDTASMRIRVLSLIPVVSLSGAELMRTETVTVLNDMCIMAPASLLDPAIAWRSIDAQSVEATYKNGPHTVHAVLVFDEPSGVLVNFWSDDRPSLAADGTTMVAQRWSTPIAEYRAMPPYRLASRGEARYAAPDGDYAYIEFSGIDVSTTLGVEH